MCRWQMGGFQFYFLLLQPQVLSWWPLTEQETFEWKNSSVHAVSGTGVEHPVTPKHLHPPGRSRTKPNQSTPAFSLFCSHPPRWTNSFGNCVGDTNTLAALFPLPCYKIIYFMINFHRSLAVPLAQLGGLWGSKRPFSLLIFHGLESKSNQDTLPKILSWREYFKSE